MPLTLTDKASRVVKFLVGLRNYQVKAAMQSYRMRISDIDEGWALLHAVGKDQLDMTGRRADDSEPIRQLVAWQRRWLPIADGAVERRFPAVHAGLFLNLSPSDGPAVAVGVRVFLDRLDEMAKADGVHGADGPRTLELLAMRGLDATTIREGRSLLAAMTEDASAPTNGVTPEQEKAAEQAAEQAMWAWYIEWSRIARMAIKQRGLLRKLGFLSGHGAGDDEAEVGRGEEERCERCAPDHEAGLPRAGAGREAQSQPAPTLDV